MQIALARCHHAAQWAMPLRQIPAGNELGESLRAAPLKRLPGEVANFLVATIEHVLNIPGSGNTPEQAFASPPTPLPMTPAHLHQLLRRSYCSTALLLALPLLNPLAAAETASIEIQRHKPNNLFDVSEDVVFSIGTKGSVPAKAEALAVVTDEQGEEVARKTIPNVTGNFEVNLGKPGRGYYELEVTVGQAPVSAQGGAENTSKSLSARNSFGVMDFVHRSAAEVRDGKYVFGLKWWAGIRNQSEMLESMSRLGLQWTRVIQNEGVSKDGNSSQKENDRPTITEIFTNFPMNAAIKVERFPKEIYDAERYGPLEEYEKKFGKGHWVVKTVPKREPYKKWLQEQLTRIPQAQNVFEIWNEPWDKMSPKEFAEICNMAAEAILEVRPDAIIGPNLAGKTGKYEYDNLFIEAGGMKGMKMVALHPYSGPTQRAWFREYEDWLEKKLGQRMGIYITEYGSHNTPEGPQKQSDHQQAVNVAQRSIVLYSNGVKALVPHIAVSAERNPTYWDDWLGLFRRNETPKPALIAHANAARMIDGSKYLGDLWFGTGIEAMVFDRKGEPVLALWAVDKEQSREIDVPAGDSKVVLTDMIGREKALQPQGGSVKVPVREAPVYLTGFSPKLLAEASKELRPDRWPKTEEIKRTVRTVGKLSRKPEMNAVFEDMKEGYEFAFVNEAVNAKDTSGFGYLGWDDEYLYFGANVVDDEILNKRTLNKLYQQDSIEFFVSTEPRETGGGFGPNDRQFFLSPTSPSGEPVVAELTERESGIVKPLDGVKSFVGPTNKGWAVKVAIPWSQLSNFKPAPGALLMVDARLNDADSSHERWKLDPGDSPLFRTEDPLTWTFVELKEKP
jgi:hypothetical protein